MSEFLRIAETVLRSEGRPMSAREIVAVAESEQLFPDSFSGATPHQTLKSKISVSIRRDGASSRFVRTAPGRFFLRDLVGGEPLYNAPPLRPPKTQESVIGFPVERLETLGRFHGIRTSWKRYLASLLSGDVLARDRHAAERDDSLKQIITYVLVTRKGSVLAYRRGAFNRVEHFLRGADCVGFGGHVTVADQTLLSQEDAGIRSGAVRELAEELRLPSADHRRLNAGEGLEILGLLNDDSSAVGRRHLAVVMRYEVSDAPEWDRPVRGEKAITRLRWLEPGDEVALNDFEYWSQLCLMRFYPDIARRGPEIKARRLRPFQLPHVLCIVGQIGSGKSEASDLLRSELGYKSVNSGRVVAELLGIEAVTDANRQQFQTEANKFIKSDGGPRLLAGAIASKAEAAGADGVVVDGIRQIATFTALQERRGCRVALLYVHAPPDVALALYNAREGTDHSMVEFAAIRESEVEAEVPRFLGVADAVLFNWTGRHQYRRLLRQFIDRPVANAR